MFPWGFSYPDISYPKAVGELPETPSTRDLLGSALKIIREDGWAPNGWGLTPPWSVLQVLWQVAVVKYSYAGHRETAIKNMRGLLDRFCRGGVALWEMEDGRSQSDVEALLLKAIEFREDAA